MYRESFEYIGGFSYFLPYIQEGNTYRISLPYTDENLISRQQDKILSCNGGFGVSIAFKKSTKSNLEQYLKS